MTALDKCTFVLLGFNPENAQKAIDELSELSFLGKLVPFQLEIKADDFFTRNQRDFAEVKRRFNKSGELSKNFLNLVVEDFLYYDLIGGTPAFIDFPKNLEQLDCFISAIDHYRSNNDLFIVFNMIDESAIKSNDEIESLNYFKNLSNVELIDVSHDDYLGKIKTIYG